ALAGRRGAHPGLHRPGDARSMDRARRHGHVRARGARDEGLMREGPPPRGAPPPAGERVALLSGALEARCPLASNQAEWTRMEDEGSQASPARDQGAGEPLSMKSADADSGVMDDHGGAPLRLTLRHLEGELSWALSSPL